MVGVWDDNSEQMTIFHKLLRDTGIECMIELIMCCLKVLTRSPPTDRSLDGVMALRHRWKQFSKSPSY